MEGGTFRDGRNVLGLAMRVSKPIRWVHLRADHFMGYKLCLDLKTKTQTDKSFILKSCSRGAWVA